MRSSPHGPLPSPLWQQFLSASMNCAASCAVRRVLQGWRSGCSWFSSCRLGWWSLGRWVLVCVTAVLLLDVEQPCCGVLRFLAGRGAGERRERVRSAASSPWRCRLVCVSEAPGHDNRIQTASVDEYIDLEEPRQSSKYGHRHLLFACISRLQGSSPKYLNSIVFDFRRIHP